MNEAKKNRIAAAATVAIILLIAILVVVLICQVATLVNKNKEKQRLLDEIRICEEELNTAEKELDYLKSWKYRQDMLTWYGYHEPD